MKTYLKTLLALLLAFACIFACISCDTSGQGGEPGGETGGETGENGGEEEIDYDNSYRVKFVYSYTAVVLNEQGRRELQDAVKTVKNIYVPFENDGFDSAMKAEIDAIQYHGYSFEKWYSEWDAEEQVGITEFSYPEGPITSDITLYGDRGDLAGPDITWSIENIYDESGEAPVLTDVVLTFTGTGPMFNFAGSNTVDIPWYDYASSVTKVVFSDGITSVGDNALNGFYKLKTIVFSNTTEVIGKNAFAYCSNSSLRKIVLPDSVKTLGENAFLNATSLKEVVLNDGLETIAGSAFYGDNGIKSIVVPASLKSIGTGAFHPGLKSGDKIGKHALSKVYYKGTAEQFATINIAIDNTWFNELATVYEYYETPRAEGGAPDESKYPIGNYWHYAVDKNNNDTTIPVQYCYALKYVAASGSTVPFEVHYVLTSPKMQDGEFVYNEDGVLILEATITEELVALRDAIVYNGYKFQSFSGQVAAGDVITDDKTFTGVRGNILNNDGGVVWFYDANTTTLTISVNSSPTLSKEIWDVSSALDTTMLHSYYAKITNVVINDGVEYIGSFAFAGFTKLQTITIPTSVKGIHEYAFDGCSNLLSIYCEVDEDSDASTCLVYRTNAAGERVAKVDGSSVQYNISNGLVGTKAKIYNETTTNTAEFGSFWMVVNKKILAWTLSTSDNGATAALEIGGDDVMVDFAKANAAPWYAAKDIITSVSFVKNITSIGKYAVNGYSNVTSISLPSNLRIIPSNAFTGTSIVKNKDGYEDGLLVIDGHLIKVDASKRDAYVFETKIGIINIASGAFDGCSAIKRLYLAPTVQYINDSAFADAEIEYVFAEGNPETWAAVSVDAGFDESVKTYFRSDSAPTEAGNWWCKNGDEYVIWGCQHVFTEWERKSIVYDDGTVYYYDPTCTTVGTDIRYCIYDHNHYEERDVAIDPDNHNFTNYVYNNDATCSKNGTETAKCSRFGCKAKDTREVANSIEPNKHVFETYIDNGDGTETATCTGCNQAQDTRTKETEEE